MNTAEIVQFINEEIARLEQARELLNEQLSLPKRGRPAGIKSVKSKRGEISAEGRARIAAAQRKRWAKAKGK